MDRAPAAALDVAANLADVRARIARACERASRDAREVTLIGVTKSVPQALVRAALAAGLSDLGENYVREGLARREALGEAAAGARWHLIGHIQSNKARAAAQGFDIIHAVDSGAIARALDSRARRPLPVLLEVNAAGEASKFGFAPREVAAAVREISRLPLLELRGLMTVAPAASDPEDVRPVFRTLRDLARANGLSDLSMGMTGDFEVAVEEGATMVRIGRAIFGERTR
ncbi:MAG TPA: YggS family pyridoxal phosphate-dependent enzyme [Dehalococcoidia bacterium]|nr:YggS family pyridoxal phosphate-dependent enzyme [Dehalococcoidia bacterium]